jgi:hypothetical protein
MNNNHYHDTFADQKYLRETDYQKFVTMKKEKHLQLSDYTRGFVTGQIVQAVKFEWSNEARQNLGSKPCFFDGVARKVDLPQKGKGC